MAHEWSDYNHSENVTMNTTIIKSENTLECVQSVKDAIDVVLIAVSDCNVKPVDPPDDVLIHAQSLHGFMSNPKFA